MTKNVAMRNVLSEDIHSLFSNHCCYFLLSLLVLLLAWFRVAKMSSSNGRLISCFYSFANFGLY